MDHADHVGLIRGGVEGMGGVWADLGSGTGAFTLALRDIVGAGARIFSVDKDAAALTEQKRRFELQFPDSDVAFIAADFTGELSLPELDGVVMANSLHFVPTNSQADILTKVSDYLKPSGRIILVEYDSDEGNRWVPYPISFNHLHQLADWAGLSKPKFLGRVPSTFLHSIYASSLRVGRGL